MENPLPLSNVLCILRLSHETVPLQKSGEQSVSLASIITGLFFKIYIMEEGNQEGRKTIVAFVAGLLVGGLLVMVFGGGGDYDEKEEMHDDEQKEEMMEDGDHDDDHDDDDHDDEMMEGDEKEMSDAEPVAGPTAPAQPAEVITPKETAAAPVAKMGDAKASVTASAGTSVALSSVTYPTERGWITVHNYADGTPGGVLGAARWEVGVLEPTSVELLSSISAGSTYFLGFHEDNQDGTYTSAGDVLMTNSDGSPVGKTFVVN